MNKLIISPHLDDEVLGCGGILDKDTTVIYCGVDESSIQQSWVRRRPDIETRIREKNQVASVAGFFSTILNQPVNQYDEQALIGLFEQQINIYKPDEIYIPHPSYNQDHCAVYKAATIALRPHDINHFVKRVLVYEQPHVLWAPETNFTPQYFIEIDIERKLHLYELYTSQVRKFRSVEHIKALARVRGLMANCEYAEAYEVMRWIN